jgi:hypothetical protein
MLDQVGFGHDAQIVEADSAFGWHSIFSAQPDLRGNPTDRARDGRCQKRGENRDGNVARHDEKGTAPDVRYLAPPNLAAPGTGYQGSSAIA